MTERNPTSYQLGQIKSAFEKYTENTEDNGTRKYAKKQLEKIGLTLPISRFSLNQKIRHIERRGRRL